MVGRLSTERYISGSSAIEKRKLTLLKRMSSGNLQDLMQDTQCDIEQINFSLYSDGLYELVMTNVSIDIETRRPDDWDLILIPIEEQKNDNY